MTLADIENAVRRRTQTTSDTAFWTQAQIIDEVYFAAQILAREALLIEAKDTSISTVAGTQSYAFPTNFISIRRVEYDGKKLTKVTFREDDTITGQNTSSAVQGTPTYYYLWDDTIYLRPLPDDAKTLTVYGFKEHTQLTSVSDTLEVPTLFHPALIDYVVSEYYAKDGETNRASYYRQLWENWIVKAKRWSKRRLRSDAPAHVMPEEVLATNILGLR